jgi:hypothetical protein
LVVRQTTPLPSAQQLPPRSTASSQQQHLLGRTTPLPFQKQQLVVRQQHLRQTTVVPSQQQPSTSQQYFVRQTTPLPSQQQQYLRQTTPR